MQVSIFISVNYNEETDEEILDQIKGYVQENVAIYSLDDGKNPLSSKWTKSTTSNEFNHDLDHSGDKSTLGVTSDIRVPLYFTVPFNSEGEHKWIAKMGDTETSSNTPVTVNVVDFSITGSDFTIEDRDSAGQSLLRVLRYTPDVFPESQKLVKCIDYKGIKFTGAYGNAWLSMVMSKGNHKAGFFLEHRNTKAYTVDNCESYSSSEFELRGYSGKPYYKTSCQAWEDPEGISTSSIDTAWGAGIVMIRIGNEYLGLYDGNNGNTWNKVDILMNNFQLRDNFGNKMEIEINWNCGDWYGCWAVSSAKVLYS